MTEGRRMCVAACPIFVIKDEKRVAAGKRAMDMRLSSEESDVLLEILGEQDQVLLEKISHTKREASKKPLRQKETLLESIIEKLVAEQTQEEFTDLWW